MSDSKRDDDSAVLAGGKTHVAPRAIGVVVGVSLPKAG